MTTLKLVGCGESSPHWRVTPTDFPSAARAARHAAQLWFRTDTDLTPAEFRDVRWTEHCQDRLDNALEREMRRIAFNRAFAEEIGRIMVEGRERARAP